MKFLASILLFSFLTVLSAVDHPQLKPFPKAIAGKERFVVALPHKERGEEDGFQVELIVGKIMETDGVNHMRLGGTIDSVNLQGWGYTYYSVDSSGIASSTLIGVPHDQPKVDKFIILPSKMIPYNSRLPIVVFVPEGFELRYRIWSRGKEIQAEKS